MSIGDVLWHRWLRRPYRLRAAIDAGKGDVVVLLHGLASRGIIWQSLAALLSPQFRVVAFDLLGFGNSPKPHWSSYRAEDHVRALEASLRERGIDKNVTLVGHSMGCLLAVHIAARHPEKIKQVILYEPPLFADIPEFSSHVRRRKLYFSMYERIADSPTMVLTYARFLGRATAKLAGIALRPDEWVPFERSLRNTIIDQQTYQELHSLKVPTDIVYGRFDLIVTQSEVRDMFKGNPNIRFHTVNDLHGVSGKSSRYLAKLIAGDTKHKKRRRVPERALKYKKTLRQRKDEA